MSVWCFCLLVLQCSSRKYCSRTVVFSDLRSRYAVTRPSSVCNARAPYQAAVIFGNISTAFGTLAILRHPQKIYGDRSRGTAPLGELNTRGVAKYSDFGPIEGYVLEMLQDRR